VFWFISAVARSVVEGDRVTIGEDANTAVLKKDDDPAPTARRWRATDGVSP